MAKRRIRTKKGLRRCMAKAHGRAGRGRCLAAYNRGRRRRKGK